MEVPVNNPHIEQQANVPAPYIPRKPFKRIVPTPVSSTTPTPNLKSLWDSLISHPKPGTVMDIGCRYWDPIQEKYCRLRQGSFTVDSQEFISAKVLLSSRGISRLATEYLVMFDEKKDHDNAVWVRREQVSFKIGDTVLVSARKDGEKITLVATKKDKQS